MAKAFTQHYTWPVNDLSSINKGRMKHDVKYVWTVTKHSPFTCFCLPFRVARSFCQSGGGRLRTMPLNRYCEKYAGPKVEPTLWSVSQQEDCAAVWHVAVCNFRFIKKQMSVCLCLCLDLCMSSSTTWNVKQQRNSLFHRHAENWFCTVVCLFGGAMISV